MAVAKAVSKVLVEEEMQGAAPWAVRHGWSMSWDDEQLLLVVLMKSSIDGERYIFEITLSDYRELPPSIELVHPQTGEVGTRRCFPRGSSYFHNQPVICAPWNRKAYQANGGPHADWAMAQWATYRPNHSRLGDILVLLQETLFSARQN